ncbi:MAG: glycosyltransferase [Atopobiaceae bacterium]|jgi:hypothetical protein|nr:glycosyltransferase [Atopobiaceae bacterium]
MTRTSHAPSAEVEFVLPVYNEQAALPLAVRVLSHYLSEHATYSWFVTIADNGSTDSTLDVARGLVAENPGRVRAVHLDEKGRGRALKRVWESSSATVVAYMDVDLSTGLDSVNALVDPLLNGEADVSIGSRLMRRSHVTRCLKREVISRCYNFLLRHAFHYGIHDAQCGFKAMTTRVARAMMPAIQSDEWFWDTEMLVLAWAAGLDVVQVPVTWVEDQATSVSIPRTVREDLDGIGRMRGALAEGTLPLDRVARSGHCARDVALAQRDPLAPIDPYVTTARALDEERRRAELAAERAASRRAGTPAPARAHIPSMR